MATPERFPIQSSLPATALQRPGRPEPRPDVIPLQQVAGTSSSQESSDPLMSHWHTLWPRRGTLVGFALLFAVLGFLVTIPQKRIYQARASLELENVNEDVLGLRHAEDPAGMYNALSDVQTQIRVLKSDSVADRTIAKLKPTIPQTANTATRDLQPWQVWLKSIVQLVHPTPDHPEDPREVLLRGIAKTMNVKPAGESRIIELTVDSADPKLGAAFANTLMNEFIDEAVEARWQMTEHTATWLSRQLDEMRIKLEHSEDELQFYARRAGLVFTGNGKEQDSVSDAKLRELEQALSAAHMDRIAKQARFEMARNSPADSLPDILNDPLLRELQAKLTDLRRDEAELSALYKPEYPKVKRLHAEAVTVEAALEKTRNAIVERIGNEYTEAVRKEDLLRADYLGQTRVVTDEGEKAIQYNILKRDVDTNRQLYEAMLQKVKEASINSAIRAANVRVIDPAKTPKQPYKPRVLLSTVAGCLFGLCAGVGFVLIRDRADRTLHQPGEISLWLGIPELGTIPSAAADAPSGVLRGRKPGEPDPGVELIALDQNNSLLAESFRVALTSILFSDDARFQPRVLVVTSSAPGEGKTTFATNLAAAMAEIGKRVLLIDADLRRPRVHVVFNVAAERGLSSVLSRTDLPDDMELCALIQSTHISGLSVMPSGRSTLSASNLLHSPRMPELLNRLQQQFDTIVIDTPPMLHMSDARVVARVADGVILVVRAGKTTRDAAMAAYRRLMMDGANVLGTILNDWNPKKAQRGSYAYQTYGEYRQYSSFESDDEDSSS